MNGIEKMNLESKNLVTERIEQLKMLFPEIVVEAAGGGGSFQKQLTSRSCV